MKDYLWNPHPFMSILSRPVRIALNSSWTEFGCTATYFDAYNRGPLSIPDTFETTMPVPGLWDQAEPELYSFDEESALWVRTTVTLPSVPEGRAVLQIGKACYGRYIYVNGNSWTNIPIISRPL